MPDETPAWLREIDHTGDVGIEVAAPSLEDLFARAAWAMFNVLADLASVQPRAALPVAVAAEDRAALLVRWLSELNFLHATQGWLFCAFEVEALGERRLAATARGERYDDACHTVYTEIKAVTFHDLTIERRGEGWHARIIFDL